MAGKQVNLYVEHGSEFEIDESQGYPRLCFSEEVFIEMFAKFNINNTEALEAILNGAESSRGTMEE